MRLQEDSLVGQKGTEAFLGVQCKQCGCALVFEKTAIIDTHATVGSSLKLRLLQKALVKHRSL